MSQYKPQFTVTDTIHRLKSQIIKQEKYGVDKPHIHATQQMIHNAHIRSVHSTLAIENILLTPPEVADIIDNEYVSCTQQEIRAVKNAYEAYNLLDPYHPPNPYSIVDILHAHRVFMTGLSPAKEVGCLRSDKLMQRHMDNLLDWVQTSDEHQLIKSCVFHHEFMLIQPFGVGNGYVARLWQILLLYKWRMPLGLPLADFILKRRQDYFDVLAIPNKATGSTKFLEFMLQAIKDAVVEFDRDLV